MTELVINVPPFPPLFRRELSFEARLVVPVRAGYDAWPAFLEAARIENPEYVRIGAPPWTPGRNHPINGEFVVAVEYLDRITPDPAGLPTPAQAAAFQHFLVPGANRGSGKAGPPARGGRFDVEGDGPFGGRVVVQSRLKDIAQRPRRRGQFR